MKQILKINMKLLQLCSTKNAAGINLTSMIVQASSNERFLLDGILKSSKMPENQFYDYCNHFNLDINDDRMAESNRGGSSFRW